MDNIFFFCYWESCNPSELVCVCVLCECAVIIISITETTDLFLNKFWSNEYWQNEAQLTVFRKLHKRNYYCCCNHSPATTSIFVKLCTQTHMQISSRKNHTTAHHVLHGGKILSVEILRLFYLFSPSLNNFFVLLFFFQRISNRAATNQTNFSSFSAVTLFFDLECFDQRQHHHRFDIELRTLLVDEQTHFLSSLFILWYIFQCIQCWSNDENFINIICYIPLQILLRFSFQTMRNFVAWQKNRTVLAKKVTDGIDNETYMIHNESYFWHLKNYILAQRKNSHINKWLNDWAQIIFFDPVNLSVVVFLLVQCIHWWILCKFIRQKNSR